MIICGKCGFNINQLSGLSSSGVSFFELHLETSDLISNNLDNKLI